jgi:hypothetical protein
MDSSGSAKHSWFESQMVTRLKSSRNREDNSMYSGIVRTALTNGLPLEFDYREPREVRTNARSQEWTVNSEEYFARIQALIANDFKRLLNQI